MGDREGVSDEECLEEEDLRTLGLKKGWLDGFPGGSAKAPARLLWILLELWFSTVTRRRGIWCVMLRDVAGGLSVRQASWIGGSRVEAKDSCILSLGQGDHLSQGLSQNHPYISRNASWCLA